MPIATLKNARTIASVIEANAPIIETLNNELSGEEKSGGGTTLDVLVPSYGKVARADGDSTAIDTNYDRTPRVTAEPITMTLKYKAVNIDLVDRAVRLNTYKKQIADPYGLQFASFINNDAFNAIQAGAKDSLVAATGATYDTLADAIAAVEESRVGGGIYGAISPRLKAKITQNGLNQFAHAGTLSTELYRGVIGEFNGADFISTPDIPTIIVPSALTGYGVVAGYTEGATTLNVTLTGGFKADIPAGTPITIAGVNKVDAFGVDTGIPATIIVAQTADEGTNALTIQPLYASEASGGKRNVTALPQAAAAITGKLTPGTRYLQGVVYAKNSTMLAAAPVKPLAVKESETSKDVGYINIRISVQGNITSGLDEVRWDTLYGIKSIYGVGALAIYSPIG